MPIDAPTMNTIWLGSPNKNDLNESIQNYAYFWFYRLKERNSTCNPTWQATIVYFSACRRLCLLLPWFPLPLRGDLFCFFVLCQQAFQGKYVISSHKVTALIIRIIVLANESKTNYQKVSTRSLYIINTGRASKAEACKRKYGMFVR